MHEQQSFSLEELPFTVYMFLFGVAVLLVGVAIQYLGMTVNAGIAGAFAVVMIGLALFTHVAIWLMGALD